MDERIDWTKMWNDFDDWIDNERSKTSKCKTCDNINHVEPDWEEQQDKIERLVNAQVQEILKTKT